MWKNIIGIILSILANFYAIGKFLFALSGQILKNNLDIFF